MTLLNSIYYFLIFLYVAILLPGSCAFDIEGWDDYKAGLLSLKLVGKAEIMGSSFIGIDRTQSPAFSL